MNGENSIGNVNVTYNLILNLVAASGKNDPAIILDFVKKYDENINSSNRQFINDLIKGAINFERDITSEQINYKTPSSEERKIFEDLINRLRSQAESADAETIQTEIYQIGKDHNS